MKVHQVGTGSLRECGIVSPLSRQSRKSTWVGRNTNCLKAEQGKSLPWNMRGPESPVKMQATLGALTSLILVIR